MEYGDENTHHLIWYEDTDSIKKKAWLAGYYGLHGLSLWHMGNFTDGDSSFIKRLSDAP